MSEQKSAEPDLQLLLSVLWSPTSEPARLPVRKTFWLFQLTLPFLSTKRVTIPG